MTRTINHRELRNHSSDVLRDVAAGEIIEVTNHGELAAVLVPPALSTFERLVVAGKVRLPAESATDFREIHRIKSAQSTAEIISDVRGDR
ncbi:MAG: type II toxin-antitoxin system Phd/YefM family antitoxin [Acidimicrobiales bacterium]